MTGTINGWSTEKLYQDLGIEYLRSRPWLRRLWLFHKTMPFPQNHLPIYLISVRNASTITPFKVRHDFFKKYCFPTVISKSKKLDLEIYHSASLEIFNKYLLRLCVKQKALQMPVFYFFFSTANLDKLTKVASRTFHIC